MSLRTIKVDSADTYYSIRHRLLWSDSPPDDASSRGGRRAVLQMPSGFESSAAPLSAIDLILLRRLADRERLEIGLVTGDKDLARQARSLGLPAFSSPTLAEYYRPGWWRVGRPRHRLGFAPGTSFRLPEKPVIPSSMSAFILQSLIFLLALALALGFMGMIIAYVVPTATIRIRPGSLPVQAIIDFTADPSALEADGQTLPTRRIILEQPWEALDIAPGDRLEDRGNISEQAQGGLAAAAPALLASQLEPGERLIPSSIKIPNISQTFSSTGETELLTLSARLEGLAVREADLSALAFRHLAGKPAAGYSTDPASLHIQIEPSTDRSDVFQFIATATARADVDRSALAERLSGQRVADVAHYLAVTYPLAESPAIDVWPSWWRGWSAGRLPWRADRIRIELLP